MIKANNKTAVMVVFQTLIHGNDNFGIHEKLWTDHLTF